MDFYEILGVAPDATTDEIKIAYRRIARATHPDVRPPQSNELSLSLRFRRATEAYDCLCNEDCRRAYDIQIGDGSDDRPDWATDVPEGSAGFGDLAGSEDADEWLDPPNTNHHVPWANLPPPPSPRASTELPFPPPWSADYVTPGPLPRPPLRGSNDRVGRARWRHGWKLALLIVVALVGRQIAADQGTAPKPAPPPASGTSDAFDLRPPAFDFAGPTESRRDGDYWASIASVRPNGFFIDVSFEAWGKSDLADPLTSCLSVETAPDGFVIETFVVYPTDAILSLKEPGHVVATLAFPMMVGGTYSFRYACRGDFALARIGTADGQIPLGVVVDSDGGWIIVFGVRRYDNTLVVAFGAGGRKGSIVYPPDPSCLDGTHNYSVNIAVHKHRVSETYLGTFVFTGAEQGQFDYGCAGLETISV